MLPVLLAVSVWSAAVGEWACWPSADPQWRDDPINPDGWMTQPDNCTGYAIYKVLDDTFMIYVPPNINTDLKFLSSDRDTTRECHEQYMVTWRNGTTTRLAPMPTQDSLWLSFTRGSVWDPDGFFNPNGSPWTRVKLPACERYESPWARMRHFAAGDSEAIQAVYGVLWAGLYGMYIYTGARQEWYTRRKITVVVEAFGLIVFVGCMIASTPMRLFWWSVFGASAAAAGIWGPLMVQLGSNGRWCGRFMLPTEERGFRLDHAVARAILPMGVLFVAAVVTS